MTLTVKNPHATCIMSLSKTWKIILSTYKTKKYVIVISGPGNSVGIATAYGLDGPGIESRWRRDFPHLSRPTLRPTHSPLQWVPGFSRG